MDPLGPMVPGVGMQSWASPVTSAFARLQTLEGMSIFSPVTPSIIPIAQFIYVC